MQGRTQIQKASITKLRLAMGNDDDTGWRRKLSTDRIRSLQGLRHLHVVIAAGFAVRFSQFPAQRKELLYECVETVLRFQTLSLTKASILIENANNAPQTWELTDRRRIANCVEQMLLGKGSTEILEQWRIHSSGESHDIKSFVDEEILDGRKDPYNMR